MNELYCNLAKCDIRQIVFFSGKRSVYPHKNRHWSAKGEKGSVGPQHDSANTTSFDSGFNRLPNEMKMQCVSSCDGFHLLVTPELWHFYKGPRDILMTDHHRSRDHNYRCRRMHMFDLAKCDTTVKILTHFAERIPKTGKNEKYLEELDYGKTDKYPCVYYHDRVEPKEIKRVDKSEVLKRYQRFSQYTGGKHEIDDEVLKMFDEMMEDYTTENLENDCFYIGRGQESELITPTNSMSPIEPQVTLRPGVYYWELTNHQWDECVAVITGQQHSPLSARQKHLISLTYRRVCHPDDSAEYTKLASFEPKFFYGQTIRLAFRSTDGSEPSWPPQCDCDYDSQGSDNPDEMCYFETTERTYYTEKEVMPVYSHVLAPNLRIKVYRSPKTSKNVVSYYDVLFHYDSRLHSIESSPNGIRLNFYFNDISNATSLYGKSLMLAMNYTDPGYAFNYDKDRRPSNLDSLSEDNSETFYDFFFRRKKCFFCTTRSKRRYEYCT